MSALSSLAVKQRLSAIMEALSRAAVAEICELVDGSYSRLCTELERTQRENEDLKKKLHVIEAIVVHCHGSGEGGKAAEPEELVLGLDAEGGNKETRRRPESDRDAVAPAGGATEEPEVTVVQLDELPDVVLIKDEDSDSDNANQQDASTPVSHSTKRHWTGSEAGGRKSPLKVARVAAERHKRDSVSVWESGRSERVENAALACSNLDQVKQEAAETDDARQSGFFSATAEPASPSNRVELDLKAMWTNLPKDHMTVSHRHQNRHSSDDDAFGLKLVNVLGSVSSEYEAPEAARYAPYSKEQRAVQAAAGGRGKRFVCSVCSKTYATAQNLDVHMRIHTGVRPFGCEHCGKKFLQSAHLKSHLSIHTGDRPHVCLICSRSFIVKYSLNLHMKKCHTSPS